MLSSQFQLVQPTSILLSLPTLAMKYKPALRPIATGDTVQAASPVVSMSMDSVLHHFCGDADSPLGTTTPATVSTQRPPTSSDSLITPAQPDRRFWWDQLDEHLKELDASGYQQVTEDAHQDLFSLLYSILFTKKSYRRLLQYRGELGQLLVNALQWVSSLSSIEPSPKLINLESLCDYTSFEDHKKRKFMKALLRLSKRAKLIPRSFILSGVEIGEVIIETSNVDIFRGLHGGREVCLKKYRLRRRSQSNAIREDLVELLIRETIIWYNLRHPNLLSFEGIFQPDGNFEKAYLVSPFYANGTVVEYLKSHPSVERRLLLSDVLSGLSYLHRNNIVHGDVKGANILVDSQGRACIADLGLSRLTDAHILTWTSIQSTLAPWGTLHWQAPELLSAQLQDQERIPPPTAFSDMYAFGCLAYEVFTGLVPFAELSTRGQSYIQIHRRISTQVVKHGRRPQKPAADSPAYLCYGLTDSIWVMMETCWAREVRCRPSADDLCRLPFLVDVLDDRSVQE
ncbi:hypothetical protein EST38_g7838 [Candolleomyces aberdarensis]|uniref:Protein kinase domain-containing protein n=1 Tax=Candolleomyces aberdarensis TaxID=2316362 RepID=A0A4Q2DGA8_9AGAR|nr:hypothetical protein EST38_g7838 [Candolleomyces aberdarensis]